MEFEVRYEQTKSIYKRNLRSRYYNLMLAAFLCLYFSYFIAGILNYYAGDKNIPSIHFQLWYALVFMISVCVLYIISFRRSLNNYFRNAKSVSVLIRINDEAFYSESDIGISKIYWSSIIKTSRKTDAFVVHLGSGDIYIPSSVLSEDQKCFIEDTVKGCLTRRSS